MSLLLALRPHKHYLFRYFRVYLGHITKLIGWFIGNYRFLGTLFRCFPRVQLSYNRTLLRRIVLMLWKIPASAGREIQAGASSTLLTQQSSVSAKISSFSFGTTAVFLVFQLQIAAKPEELATCILFQFILFLFL